MAEAAAETKTATSNVPDVQETQETQTSQETKYVEEKVLVTIEKIDEVVKHPNADNLHIVTVQNYRVIINIKSTYGENTTPEDLVDRKVVYFQIDSVLPDTFKDEGFWNYLKDTYMGKKLISAKLRGVISQGMTSDFESIAKLFPHLTVNKLNLLPLGHNLTNELGVIKFYDMFDPEGPMYGGAFDRSKYKNRPLPISLRPFPSFLQKTDQPKLQFQYKIIRSAIYEEQVRTGAISEKQIANMKTSDLPVPNRLFTVTIKYDGQSVQWFKKSDQKGDQVGVCSRNFEVRLDTPDQANDKFREMDAKYRILEKLKAYPRNISIQTEMYGMAINNNRHKKKEVDLVVFDVFDIDIRSFVQHDEMVRIAKEFGIPTVEVVKGMENAPLISLSVDKWVEVADAQRYAGGLLAEGIVVKSSDGKYPYINFKVISPAYLIKHGL